MEVKAMEVAMVKRMLNRKRQLPSIEELLKEARRLFRYDKESGDLIWQAFANPAKKGMAKIGAVVGGDDGHGYRMCALLGHKFKVHQVVWLMHTGEFPCMHADRPHRQKQKE